MTISENERDYNTRVGMTPSLHTDDDTHPSLRGATAGHTEVHRGGPAFEGRDIVAGALAATMMLGPLLAYAVGLGPS